MSGYGDARRVKELILSGFLELARLRDSSDFSYRAEA